MLFGSIPSMCHRRQTFHIHKPQVSFTVHLFDFFNFKLDSKTIQMTDWIWILCLEKKNSIHFFNSFSNLYFCHNPLKNTFLHSLKRMRSVFFLKTLVNIIWKHLFTGNKTIRLNFRLIYIIISFTIKRLLISTIDIRRSWLHLHLSKGKAILCHCRSCSMHKPCLPCRLSIFFLRGFGDWPFERCLIRMDVQQFLLAIFQFGCIFGRSTVLRESIEFPDWYQFGWTTMWFCWRLYALTEIN